MAKNSRGKYKKILLQERERLVHEINERENESIGKSSKDFSGDLSAYTIHLADLASDNIEKDMSLDILSSEERLLVQIQKALERIEEGTYGVCTQCKGQINKKRMDAIPYASLCKECKEKEEKK